MLFGIMARLEGFEPPTYRFEVSIHTLTLKKINKLQPKIPNKLGKFRKPRANALLRKAPGLTRRRMKKLDAIAQIHEQRHGHKTDKAYSARPFVLCGIPVRRPAKHVLEYSRQNGR